MPKVNNTKTPKSFRLSPRTIAEVAALAAARGTTQAEVVTIAIHDMYQKEQNTMATQTATYQAAAAQYGTVIYDGQEYALLEPAQLSNRVFPGWWGDAIEEEPEYTSEWQAQAIDGEGNRHYVVWQFDAVKYQEPEDDSNWPWDDEHVTAVKPLD